MAVLPIVKVDNPILRQKAKKITHIDSSLQKLIDDMIETMHAANGVGLAAPQVGVPLRLAVVQEFTENEAGDMVPGQVLVLINPEIIKTSGEYEVEEGCLSLPGYVGTIKRAEKVTLKALNRQGKEIRIKADGLLAEAFQHEVDHLNGTLFFDHLPSMDQLRQLHPRQRSPRDQITEAEEHRS